MKKKYILLVVFLYSVIFFPNKVLANGNIGLSLICNNTSDQTYNISCDLIANTNEKTINELAFKYNIDSSIKFGKFESNVGSPKINGTTISLTNLDFSGNNFKVGTLYFKNAGGSSGYKNINLQDIYYYINEAKYNYSQINTSVYISLSNKKDITNLNVSSGVLSPEFNSSTYNYYIKDYTSDTITISANHNGSSISGIGTHNLNLGDNVIKLIVTAQDNTIKTYKITVTRIIDIKDDTTLDNISISNGELNFDSNKREYNINVTTSKIEIDVEKKISTQNVQITPNKVIELGYDELKEVTINVTSESGKSDKYTLYIKRVESNDPSLDFKSFKINGTDFELNEENNVYNISVANSVTQLNLEYELDDNSLVEISGNENFRVGTNEVIIVVKNANEEEKKYTFWVNRKENIDVLENDLEQIILELEGNKNKIYVNIKHDEENKIIYKDVLNKLCKTDKTLTYDILNKNEGILYSIILNKINCNEYNEDIDISIDITNINGNVKKLVKKNNFIYVKDNNIILPNGSKFKIFVGDIFDNDKVLYLYRYDKDKLTLLESKIKVKDGFVTFEVDNLSNLVITDYNKDSIDNLIDPENKNDSKPNKLFVSISLVVEFSIIIGLIIYIIICNIKLKKINI